MNLNEVKKIFKDNGFGDAFTYYDSFVGWIGQKEKENPEMADTFKSIEAGIEEIEKKIDIIDKNCSKFMSAHDTSYPRQYPKQKGNFPQHYSNAKSTPPKKKVDPMFQEREKSDAGKLADKFTELLKKK